jgi:phosphohistidine phosphatase SixA
VLQRSGKLNQFEERRAMKTNTPATRFAMVGLLLLISALPVGAQQTEERLPASGHVLMIRHALAPGSGDPDNFRIGDCDTQRNLNDQGRRQAAQIGEWLRTSGIQTARVYSSQWCRCLETAALLKLGPVAELPALNSFYERPQDRAPNLAALRSFLARQPVDDRLIVLVTHYVTIVGLADRGVGSGEGVLLKLESNGNVSVVKQLDFGL